MSYAMTSPLELAKFLAAQPVVLVAESNPQDAEVLLSRLRQLDCNVIYTTPADLERLKELTCQRCDAILLDVSGLEAAHSLKVCCPNIPIIVMMDDEENFSDLLSVGPVTLVRKLDLTLEVIASLLQTFKLKVRPPSLSYNPAQAFAQ